MGYAVRKLNTKKRSWKVQFIDYEGGGQSIRDLPESEFIRLGFVASMTFDEACKRKDQLNAQGHVQRNEVKRGAIAKRIDREEQVLDAYLDKGDVKEFEDSILFVSLEANEFTKRNKLDSHWRRARRILVELKLEPQDWDYQKKRFYEIFTRSKISPDYAKKIIGILNLWGRFHCRKYGKYFEPLGSPTGRDKERIADAYYDKAGQGRVSDPITPQILEHKKSVLKPEWYAWFYLSIWFGLRPFEVDALLKPTGSRTWHVGVENGTPYLAVYQTKLVGIPRDKRTKKIPCILPEQVYGLKVIEQGKFKRPSHSRHVQRHFGENVTLYGGRKGFQQLMRSYGQALEDIATWMGHQSIEQTWRSYKDKQALNFTPVLKQPKATSKELDYSTLDDT